jgi:hypothetical protein
MRKGLKKVVPNGTIIYMIEIKATRINLNLRLDQILGLEKT